jgi:hypothetical protein
MKPDDSARSSWQSDDWGAGTVGEWPRCRTLVSAREAGINVSDAQEGEEIVGLDLLPDTPLGARARWVLARLPFDHDLERAKDLDIAHGGAVRTIVLANRLDHVRRPLRVTSVATNDPREIAIDLVDEDATDWRLSLRTEGPDARVANLIFERPLAAGIRIEQAFDDPPSIDMIALERAIAIEARARTQSIDRSRSLADHLRLVDHVFSTVAYHGDTAVAMSMAILRSVTDVDGDTQVVVYGGRDRVHPDYRGRRLSDSLRSNRSGKLPRFDGQYFVVDPDNVASMARVSDRVQRLGVVLRVPLATQELAGPEIGRRATPEDIDHLHTLLQATHGREFLWGGNRAARLEERLSRTEAYTWNDLRFTDKAMVGTWLADERRTVSEERGEPRVVRRALVLDYAVADGGEEDFEALLRAACTDAHVAGLDELVVTADSRAKGVDVLTRLGHTTERLDAFTPDLAIPDDLDERGVWFDPIYV